MSVHKHKNGWIVKWRVDGKPDSRVFPRGAKDVAELLDREIKTRKALGKDLSSLLDRTAEITLADFIAGPFHSYASGLAPATRAKDAWALASPTDGSTRANLSTLLDVPLAELTVARLADEQDVLRDRGVSAKSRREMFARLSGVLQLAAERGLIQGNPARTLRKDRVPVAVELDALTPRELEQLIDGFTGRGRAIAVLGGRAGLRPIEIRNVTWDRVRGDTLHISRSATKKTAARSRAIKLDRRTLSGLRHWQLESGGRGPDLIVGEMSENALKLWGVNTLRRHVEQTTGGRVVDASVYTLRHAHASALHYAGFTLPETLERLGHGQQVHIQHYAHVLKDLGGERYDGLDALYDAARAEGVGNRADVALGEP